MGDKKTEITTPLKDITEDDEMLYKLSEFFRMYSDETRLKIIYALMPHGLSVIEIAEAIDSSQSAVSHQLRLLKQTRLVKSQRKGRNIIYSLDDNHVYTIIAQGIEHISE